MKKMVPILSKFLFALAIIFCLPIMPVNALAAKLPFKDVTENWAYSSISTCYEKGWILGTSSTTFAPKNTLSRGQFVTILGRYAGVDNRLYTKSKFQDVSFSSWGYAPYVAWAEVNGIANGIDKNQFSPNGPVTRAQMVVFLYNYIQYLNVELETIKPDVTFTDYSKIPTYAREAVMVMSRAGVVSGSNGAFDPNSICTREMTASFLVKFNNALATADPAPKEPQIKDIICDNKGVPTLYWEDIPNVSGYFVYRRNFSSSSSDWECVQRYLKGATFTDNTAVANSKYEYSIRSYNYYPLSGHRLYSSYGTESFTIATAPAISISPTSKTYQNTWVNSAYYNNNTKDYYLIRSYLDSMKNGGTLVLEAGEYNIPYTIFIPSNVTIRLNDGVVINKTIEVGSSSVLATKILFAFIDSDRSNTSNAISGYNGITNSGVIGQGTVSINCAFSGSTGFLLGHNKNIRIKNLIVNVNDSTSYAMKVYGSQNINVSGCTFSSTVNAVTSLILEPAGGKNASAPAKWCAMDNTLNNEIKISGCTLSGFQYGINNKYYVTGGYNKELSILNCSFTKIANEAVRAINWDGLNILDSEFKEIGPGVVESNYSAIHLFGVKTPVIKNNVFNQMPYAITIAYNSGDNSNSLVSDEALSTMATTSTASNLYKYYVALKNTNGTNTLKYFIDKTNLITINKDSTPFQNRYTEYNDLTRFYYNMQAALDQMEAIGGGKIVVQSGNYVLSGQLYIPSNTEIVFEDGVRITKNPGLQMMFSFANKQDIKKGIKYKGYNGAHDSSIHATEGATVIFDNNFEKGNIIELGHTKNIEIYGITFKNMHGDHHLIELDASYNTSIHNNIFDGCLDTGVEKEAINLDVPDKATGGFGGVYSSFDKTGNNYIYIYNNMFSNVPAGLGTHMYTDIAPHKNITIKDNTFSNILYYGIVAKNWNTFTITGNSFNDIGVGGKGTFADSGCVFKMNGVTNPTIQSNIIKHAAYFIRIGTLYYSPENIDNEVLLGYEHINNKISATNKNSMFKNTCKNVTFPLIYYRNTDGGNYETWYKLDFSAKEFTLTPSSTPYLGLFLDYDTYNDDTKYYYILKSYLDQLDAVGGGTIHIEKGVYPITRLLYVPSNVTIIMDEETVIDNKTNGSIIFNLRSQNTSLESAGNYAAATNIKISGGIINTGGDLICKPIYAAKVDNITIENVTFKGGSGNYISILSSKDVIVNNCNFNGNTASNAVYIGNPYNDVVCSNITISNSKFIGVQSGVLTSIQEKVYHNNIAIINNNFDSCTKNAISLYRVKTCTISQNSFANMVSPDYYGIRLYGMDGLSLQKNTFINMNRCGAVIYNVAYGKNTITSTEKNAVRTTNIYNSDVSYPYISFQADGASEIEYLNDVSSLGTSFMITPTSDPYLNKYINYDTYNSKTKQYYVLQSYLDLASLIQENVTITLGSGEYIYSNTIFIPSNVTIVLSNGTTVKYNSESGGSTLFVFAESGSAFNSITSVGTYGGVRNSVLKGEGTIDLGGQAVFAVTIPKCSGIEIKGIKFTGGASGNYYIRDWSSQNVKVTDCIFSGNRAGDNYGIGVSGYYTTIPCDGITISSCTFTGLKCGVYSTNSSTSLAYHKGVNIDGNTFQNTKDYTIYGVGWKQPKIINNKFNGLTSSNYSVQLYGVVDPAVYANTFTGTSYCVQISYKSPFTTNSITDQSKNIMCQQNNFGSFVKAIIYRQSATASAEEWDVINTSVGNNFTISPSSNPYGNAYTNNSDFNSNTKQFYVLQSYLDLASKITDNVTITLEAGVYSYTNTIFIPSNVTIVLSEGTTVKHNSSGSATTLFVFAENSGTYNSISSVGKYGGVKNAKLIGKGVIDLEGQAVYAITLPKCSNVTISGITFKGTSSGGYYIRDWSSQNVTVSTCVFEGSSKADNYGIVATGYYSAVPCNGLTITGSTFKGMLSGIYITNSNISMEYHTNISISGNRFENNSSYAIYAVGVNEPEILNNTFIGLESNSNYYVQFYGIKNPNVSGNTFSGVSYCIQISYKSPFVSNSITDAKKTIMIGQNNFGNFITAIIYRQDSSASAVKWK